MNLASILVLAAMAVLFLLAVRSVRRNGFDCGGDCSRCGGSCPRRGRPPKTKP